MNRVMAASIGFLNGLIAAILIAGGMLVGAISSQGPQVVIGILIGAIIGFIIALIACGILALFIEMRAELVRIREALERSNLPPQFAPQRALQGAGGMPQR